VTDYKAIFDGIESTLFTVGSRNLAPDEIRRTLAPFRYVGQTALSDNDYYQLLVAIVFYSGFRAATVTAKIEVIRRNFPNHETVSTYGPGTIAKVTNDPEMIRSKRKIQACVDNARTFVEIINQYGSFQRYLDSFQPADSFENLMLLKEELEYRFAGLGRITSYHFLTDIGLPVLKPDRVIARIFKRLGLIEDERQLLKTVIQGRRFAEATGHPIRYIDIVFVLYGQVSSPEVGLDRGICLEANPNCSICGIQSHCVYYAGNVAAGRY
jgi:DNA-3-methyladenine glycosylase I